MHKPGGAFIWTRFEPMISGTLSSKTEIKSFGEQLKKKHMGTLYI